MSTQSQTATTLTTVLLGLENVGKTQLLASLVGKLPLPENFRGSTLACETYRDGKAKWIDTPGLHRESETATTRAALASIEESDRIALIARASRASEELASLLPIAAGRPGFVILTFADEIPAAENSADSLTALQEKLGVPVFLIDARKPPAAILASLRSLANAPVSELTHFPVIAPSEIPAPFAAAPDRRTWLDKFVSFPLVALALLFLPAAIAVVQANRIADALFDSVKSLLDPALAQIATWPSLLAALFGGDYGLVSMFPFLILYAAPTILVFSAILAIYKSTGLIEKISVALHPYLRPFGIGGRDLVRVMMGFGCNVPAIISSRACTSCSRGACVSAISFGSACSYQLPATLAVFAAAGMAGMGLTYLAVLSITTLIYLRFTTPRALRLATNKLLIPEASPLRRPSWLAVWRETAGTLKQFVIMAFPIFIGICFAAAALAWLGVLDALSKALTPLMALFNLPGEAATAIVLGSIRKDGLAIGLLDSEWGALKVALTTPAQVLTAVYLAGVLLPCLVTLVTIGREMKWKFAVKLCARQMAWAAGFSLIIAWAGHLMF
ncbi:MAG: ferrous iron transporter B [Verrucomicrobia bacterium]|nr:MAG: ferrous iron transporter B [Verrucomicrobiota bacterium]